MATPHRRRTDIDSSGSTALRALVVDDDSRYRDYITALLKRFDFEVLHAAAADEAHSALEESAFDLLIFGVSTPGVDGMKLIQDIRANRRCADAYALMMSEQEDLDAKIKALRGGFDDFVVKSTPDAELVATIGAARRLIMRQRRLDSTVRQLYGLATRDELTGLFNRRYFFAEAERLLAEGVVVNLVLFDLDRFKEVNDTFGHLAGDRILRDAGALFLSHTRAQDIIARYGGDEFVLLVHSLALDEVEVIAERLARDLGSLQWMFGTGTVRIGVTTGLASSKFLERPNISQLLNAGDRDLYKNKWIRSHPDQDPSLYEYPISRANLLSELIEFPSRPIDLKLTERTE